MKKNSGITLLALIITIIIMLILAGVTISIVGGSDGIVAKAEKAVSQTDKAAMQEDAELAIASIKMDYYENYAVNRAKYANAKAFIVDYLEDEYTTSRGAKIVADSQGNVIYTYKSVATEVTLADDGSVSFGESSGSGEPSVGEIYYGDSSIVPTDQKYFTFTTDESTMTATITGIKDEYAVKGYYADESTNCAITDNGIQITDIVIPYEYIDDDNNKYPVTTLGAGVCGTPDFEYAERNDAWNLDKTFTSCILPNTIINVEDKAFATCINLETVVMPNVTQIGIDTFSACEKLKNITIPKVTSIEGCAFLGCKSLGSIDVPNSVTTIGDLAFANCTSLSAINIPKNVTTIGIVAFGGCTSLRSINIPESVTIIGERAFSDWTSEQTINCEIEEKDKPSGWDAKWDYYDFYTPRKAQLKWGVSM